MKKQQTTIEICGIGFPNKGAELMLVAIMQYLQGRQIRWCMAPKNDYMHRNHYPLWQKTEINRFGLNFAKPFALLPWKLRRFFGLINENEIDMVFDASGFAYGDQWGLANSQRLAKNIVKWKRQNKKVVLFPQALGPFEAPGHAELMQQVCDSADLIFARDMDSYNSLKKLATKDTVFLSPDFTPLVETGPGWSTQFKDHVCIIPNNKMLTKGTDEEKKHYVDFIVHQLKVALQNTDKVLLLSHDGERDKALLDTIKSRVEQPVQCLYIDSALELKAVIANSKVVVSSRFHGLVSALSNGVPVIATGWSHKYQHLLNDYNSAEHLYKSQDKEAAGDHLHKLLSDTSYYDAIQQNLTEKQIEHKQKVKTMWQKIIAVTQLDNEAK